ncbi:hypothetical protein BC828DRAFT_404348 [Blastocladiella britannica]|nr:hypothetical protein BC828DRAFT_404348 [Blastocladiella britannica]
MATQSSPPAPPLAHDRDCLPCRLTGSAAFGGLAGYSFYQATMAPGFEKLPMNRRVAMGVLGVCFASASIARLVF